MNPLRKFMNMKRLEFFLENVPMNMSGKPIKVLDIGCSDGWHVHRMRKHGFDAKGIDLYAKESEFLIRGDVANMPFKDNDVDCITAFEIIEHISKSAYEEIRRVLKPNGLLLVTSPNPKWDKILWLLAKLKIINPRVTPHINLSAPEDLPFTLLYKSNFYMSNWKAVYHNRK